MEKEFIEGRLSGVKASIGGPTITHVMYAYDIIFTKANRSEAKTLNNFLEKYCSWSDQQVIRAKSSLIFSKTSPKSVMRMVKHILQMKCLAKDAKYMGSPMFLSRAPTKDFQFFQEKLKGKLKGWRSKCLSWARRCTLIKSMARIPQLILLKFQTKFATTLMP